MRFLTPEQVAVLAKQIEGRYNALVFVAAYGGLRIGELAGLRRGRFLSDGSVDVVENIVEVAGNLQYGQPKTLRGRRRVPLPDQVAERLDKHLVRYVPDDDPAALIFGGPTGCPLRASAWRNRVLYPAASSAGLGRVSPHDLRHTAVAIWIAAGVPVKEIADRAGHASVASILDRYGHLLPDSHDGFKERVGGLFVP